MIQSNTYLCFFLSLVYCPGLYNYYNTENVRKLDHTHFISSHKHFLVWVCMHNIIESPALLYRLKDMSIIMNSYCVIYVSLTKMLFMGNFLFSSHMIIIVYSSILHTNRL